MSSMQITATQNSICSSRSICIASKSIYPSFRATRSRSALVNLSANASYFKQGLPVLKYKHRRAGLNHQHTPIVSLFGSKGKESGDGGSPWKTFDKVVENFKKGRSVEDVLRQQIEKKEFYDGGDGGKRPPSGGGGSGDSSSGSEDDSLGGIIDETLQVILATIGFIFLYIYIISGEELTRLAKDYIKFVFGGSKSVRLKRAMYKWGRFYQKLTEKKQYDEYWLEKAIINTPTWWDHPDKYRRAVMDYMESQYENQHSASNVNDDAEMDVSNSDDET
ncbi:uncharacterized protein LOC111010834 [Momordica charantia]|uniref:Uncharacterized protein LOC111010834 n=1 Tax=Momordica charantia TaxID=3673 RepID=A0A6J1CES8_MOMCH|nr:uncharacterized protein LOC111010834 [Momordica charantia]